MKSKHVRNVHSAVDDISVVSERSHSELHNGNLFYISTESKELEYDWKSNLLCIVIGITIWICICRAVGIAIGIVIIRTIEYIIRLLLRHNYMLRWLKANPVKLLGTQIVWYLVIHLLPEPSPFIMVAMLNYEKSQ